MTALSDRIAAVHQAGLYPVNGLDTDTRFFVGDEVESRCSCGDTSPVTEHLVDVTERAVRDAIATELEARVTRNIGGHPYSDVARTYQLAARIAREGTTP